MNWSDILFAEITEYSKLVFLAETRRASEQCGSLARASERRRGFAPQLFALEADGLGHHQSRGRQVVGGGLLLMRAVDVTGDEEGDFPDLFHEAKKNKHKNKVGKIGC